MIFFMTFFVTFQCHCNDFLGKVGTIFCMNDFYDNFFMIFLTIFSCLFLGTMTHCNEFLDGYLDHFLMIFWLLFFITFGWFCWPIDFLTIFNNFFFSFSRSSDPQCHCNDGFGGPDCSQPDVNECKYRPCSIHAECTNTLGSFTCACREGKNKQPHKKWGQNIS